MFRERLRRVFASLVLACVAAGPLAWGATVHVSPSGADTNPGNEAQPVATLHRAVAMVVDKEEACEIIVHKGVYRGEVNVGQQKDWAQPRPPLVITAAKTPDGGFEEVILDGGRDLDAAEPVEGKPGVYRAACDAAGSRQPHIWEAVARIRYSCAADLAAVEQFPATFWWDGRHMYVHTSDGRSPKALGAGMSDQAQAICLWRQNTTVRGLRFRNFLAWNYGGGVTLRAPNTAVEDCSAWNCMRAFQASYVTGHLLENMRILRCRTEDCVMGAYVEGAKRAVVEDCRFILKRDRFMIPAGPQQQVGIKFYSTATEGVVRGNLCVGFNDGIFLKCVNSEFIVEHNTVLDGITEGVGCTSWNPKTVCRYNIISGFAWPISCPAALTDGAVVDYNCIWASLESNALQKCRDEMSRVKTGTRNIYVAPRFASPGAGDYRLLPGSPCLTIGPKGENCGAFGAVGPDFKDTEPPRVTFTLGPPAKRAGGSGELYFERDPWLGGGRNLVRDLDAGGGAQDWVTAAAKVGLLIGAEDDAGKPAQMRMRLGQGPWSEAEPYAAYKILALPDGAAMTSVSVTVADGSGNWSAAKTLFVRRLGAGPKLKTAPVVYANDNGVVVSFETDAPCLAKIEYGLDAKYGAVHEQPKDVQRSWLPSDGGDWVEVRSRPRVTNYLVLMKPDIATGKTYHYRLILVDEAGNTTVTEDATFAVAGPAKTYCVSPKGEDADGAGTSGKPWRTIQFAVDRALPGDKIVLAPGLYPGETTLTHGGLDGAAIRIEAERPGTAVLDGRHEATAPLRMEKAPNVSVHGLEIRWWTVAGVYVADSPNVSVSHCRIWNDLMASWTNIGSAVFAHRSPGFAADHNVMYLFERGIMLLQSPRARITHNTILMNFYGALQVVMGSAEGTVCRNNSFAYSGGTSVLSVHGNTVEQMATFDSDYNNLGTQIGQSYIDLFKTKGQGVGPLPEFTVKDKAFQHHGTKYVVDADEKRYLSLAAWQNASGKEKHSIFADPEYVDARRFDFRLKPGSANIGAGEGGATIGALGVKEE